MAVDDDIKCQSCGYVMHPPFGTWNLCPECGTLVQPQAKINRAGSLFFALVLCAAFAVVVISGDQSRTIWSLMMRNSTLDIGTARMFSWGGALLLIGGCWFRTAFLHISATGAGLLLLLVGGAFFSLQSSVIALTLATALPFLGLVLLRSIKLAELARVQREVGSRPH